MVTNTPSSNGNGKHTVTTTTTALRKRASGRAPTSNYQPSSNAWYGAGTAALHGRPIFTWLDIPMMMTDPKVRFVAQLWRAPFQKVTFTVKASSPKVAAFVQNTLGRFWRASLPRMLSRYFRFGFAAGGAEYTAKRGWVRLARVTAIAHHDAQPRVWKDGEHVGQFAGFMLQNGGTTGGQEWVGVPHAMWFAGQQEYSPWYDVSPLSGMFEPWLEKNGRNGAIHLRREWFQKNAATGITIHYPPGVSNCGTDENPEMRDNQDLARETADYARTNSALIIENTKNPADPSKYDWDVEEAVGHADIAGFLEYPDKLDEKMVEGAGIPLEVIQGSDSGSGYKGRLVSYGGFLGTVDELVGVILESCEFWLYPLVRINYGEDAWYEVEPVSLSKIAAEEEKRNPTNPVGTPLASLPPGGGGGGGGAGEFQAEGIKTNAPLPFQLSTVETITPVKKKLGCALINLPLSLANQIRALSARIPDAALGEDGREEEPHVTVRFGLHATNPHEIQELLEETKPFRIGLGGVSVFAGKESGKDYDVLKIDVESLGLRRLHRELAVLPHTDTHKDYCPHITIAYVKEGTGAAFAALAPPFDADFTAKEVVYSDPSKVKTVIPLKGTGEPCAHELAATVGPNDLNPEVKAAAFNQTQARLMRSRKSTIAQLLALAMVRKQQEATAAGKPSAAAGSLQALSELAGDPMQVARIVGLKMGDEQEMSALELSWTDLGPSKRAGSANRVWLNTETQEKRYQPKKPGEAKEKREESDRAAKEVINKIVGRKGEVHAEDLKALADSMPHMRLADINTARRSLEAAITGGGVFNLKGKRKKLERVDLLLSYVEEKVGKLDLKAPEPTPTPVEAKVEPEPVKAAQDDVAAEPVKAVESPKVVEEPAPKEEVKVEVPATPAKEPAAPEKKVSDSTVMKARVAYDALAKAVKEGENQDKLFQLAERAYAATESLSEADQTKMKGAIKNAVLHSGKFTKGKDAEEVARGKATGKQAVKEAAAKVYEREEEADVDKPEPTASGLLSPEDVATIEKRRSAMKDALKQKPIDVPPKVAEKVAAEVVKPVESVPAPDLGSEADRVVAEARTQTGWAKTGADRISNLREMLDYTGDLVRRIRVDDIAESLTNYATTSEQIGRPVGGMVNRLGRELIGRLSPDQKTKLVESYQLMNRRNPDVAPAMAELLNRVPSPSMAAEVVKPVETPKPSLAPKPDTGGEPEQPRRAGGIDTSEKAGQTPLQSPKPVTRQELDRLRDQLDADREAGRLVNQMSTRSGPDRLTQAAWYLKERERLGAEKTQIDPSIVRQILTSYVDDPAQKGYRQVYLNAAAALDDVMTPAEKQGFVDAWANDLAMYSDFSSGRQKPYDPNNRGVTGQQAADNTIGDTTRKFLLERYGDNVVELPRGPHRKRPEKARVRDLLTTEPVALPVKAASPKKLLTSIAKETKDEFTRNLIEAAVENDRDGTPESLARTLGGYVEDRKNGPTGAIKQDTAPEVIEAVLASLVKLGAHPTVKTGVKAPFSNISYQPLEGAFPGDEIEVVRPPMMIGDRVVYKGVARVGKK